MCDVFAVIAYFTISLMFWFIGLIPDLATLRDRTSHRAGRWIYGILAMGWRGWGMHWHATSFPPYFVAGAIYSGFAMVLTLAIPLRKDYGLEDFITMKHLNNMAKVMLATGLIVAYGYFIEFFMAKYSGNKFDLFLVDQRLHGPYAPFYYALILCNILLPQLLWSYKMRHNVAVLFIMSIVVNIGMWLGRFVIGGISFAPGFGPSALGPVRSA